jgi:hypothetical protein
MKQIINKLIYDTEEAECVASNHFWDGHNFERNGRNMYLYKTKKGNFFLYHTTLWQGEQDFIEPIDKADAERMFEELHGDPDSYSTVFGRPPEKA